MQQDLLLVQEEKRMVQISQNTINLALQWRNTIIYLGSGCRSKIDHKDKNNNTIQKFPRLFYQNNENRSFNCVWLSICAMVHRQSQSQAKLLYDLLLEKKHEGLFQQMSLSNNRKQGFPSASEFLKMNSSFETRKVAGFKKNASNANSFILGLTIDVVCILKIRMALKIMQLE